MSRMANHWVASGNEVSIVTLAPKSEDFYPLASAVRRVPLDLASVPSSMLGALMINLRRLLGIRHAIRASEAEGVISFMDKTNLLTLTATMGLRVPVIVSERRDPSVDPLGRSLSLLRRLLYRRASAVIVQTERVTAWARGFLDPTAVRMIPNAIEYAKPGPHLPHSFKFRSPHNVVAVGRLYRQKGFDLLLEAFTRCAPAHPDWSLTIFGEGLERTHLESMVLDLGLEKRVELPGRFQSVTDLVARADLFVLPSRSEGFPNALLEAMAAGVAVVSFDCPSGPREIITDGKNGILVPPEDVDALVTAMDRLMSDDELRDRLGDRAREVSQRFSVERIMSLWDEALRGTRKAR